MPFGLIKLKVSDIVISDRARKDYGDLEELKASIEQLGLIQPVAVDQNNKLLAGGRRLQAHKELGLEEIEAFCLGNIDEENALIIELTENAVRKDFTWQEEVALKQKLHDVLDRQAQAKGDDSWTARQTAESLGVSQTQLSRDLTLAASMRFFPEINQYETKSKAFSAYTKIKKRAQAMACMNNLNEEERERLEEMQNSCPTLQKLSVKKPNVEQGAEEILSNDIEEETVDTSAATKVEEKPDLTYAYITCSWRELLPKFPDRSIGFCEMDPPYAMDFENTYGKAQNIHVDFKDWSVEEYKLEMKDLLTQLKAKLIQDSWVLVWTAYEWVPFLQSIAKELLYRIQSPGIWAKPGGTANSISTNMISNYETYLLFAHGQPQFNTPRLLSAFSAKGSAGANKIHATEKPVSGVYSHLFEALGRPHTNFFSPFAGSGNALIAAGDAQMIPFGCDINEQYKDQFYLRLNRHLKGGK